MQTTGTGTALGRVFAELVNGTGGREAFVLNRGDIGLIRSLERLSAQQASESANGGATIAAHAQHLRYGLSLMNEWASAGGNPFANAKWDEAWKTSSVDDRDWQEIREGLRVEAERWLDALRTPRDVSEIELAGMMSSVAHLAYHLGAIRQISRATRGPTEGTFS